MLSNAWCIVLSLHAMQSHACAVAVLFPNICPWCPAPKGRGGLAAVVARAQVSDATFLGWLTDICSLTLLVKGIICLILWIGAAQG